MWGIAAGVVGAFGIVSLIVVLGVLVLASAGTFASVLSLVAAALPIGLALLLWGRVRRITEEMKGSVADAWRIVTEDVVNTKGAEVTAADVAKSMRIGEARADALLSELSAHDVLRARVTDEGELAFSTRGAPRLRIEDTESEALAETEAEAAENAARRPRTSEKESD